MVGDSDGDGVSAGGGLGDDGRGFGEDEGKGAGPEVFGEDVGHFGPAGGVVAGGGGVGDVDDEGIGGRPAFCGVDFGAGVGAGGVGAEAVHRLGRDGDEPAATQPVGGHRDVGRHEAGDHAGTASRNSSAASVSSNTS